MKCFYYSWKKNTVKWLFVVYLIRAKFELRFLSLKSSSGWSRVDSYVAFSVDNFFALSGNKLLFMAFLTILMLGFFLHVCERLIIPLIYFYLFSTKVILLIFKVSHVFSQVRTVYHQTDSLIHNECLQKKKDNNCITYQYQISICMCVFYSSFFQYGNIHALPMLPFHFLILT